MVERSDMVSSLYSEYTGLDSMQQLPGVSGFVFR